MDIQMLELCFFLTLGGYMSGFITHWFLSRKNRRILKAYRNREAARKHSARPVE